MDFQQLAQLSIAIFVIINVIIIAFGFLVAFFGIVLSDMGRQLGSMALISFSSLVFFAGFILNIATSIVAIQNDRIGPASLAIFFTLGFVSSMFGPKPSE